MIARLECVRMLRSRRPALAVASLVFFLALMLLGFYTYAQTQTGGEVDFRYTYENRSYFNGLTFALYAFYFGFQLVLPIFVAAEGGVHLAGETSAGTMRLLLARPLSRARLFSTKLSLALAYSTALTGGFLALALGVGLVAVGWGDVDLYPGVLQMSERHEHLDQALALQRFLWIWPVASLAMTAPLCLSFLLSAYLRSPVNAVACSVALYLVLFVVSEIHFFEELRPWLFTSSMSYWRELLREEIDWKAVHQSAASLAGWSILFSGLALARFRHREEP